MRNLLSSWLHSYAVEAQNVRLQAVDGHFYCYTNVPKAVIEAMERCSSPASFWMGVLKGRYGEEIL